MSAKTLEARKVVEPVDPIAYPQYPKRPVGIARTVRVTVEDSTEIDETERTAEDA